MGRFGLGTGRLRLALGLMLCGLLAARGGSPAEGGEPPRSEELGRTAYQRLLHYRIALKMDALASLLRAYREAHGSLPPSLADLEPALGANPARRILSPDFYRIAADAASGYRYVYQPRVAELPLVALPREAAEGLLTIALDEQLLLVGGVTGGRMPAEPPRGLSMLDLYREVDRGGLRLESTEFGALWGLWSLDEAQRAYSHLHGGRWATDLGELTRLEAPARFPLLDREDLEPPRPPWTPEQAARQPDFYAVSFGTDSQGWWAEAAPKNLDPSQACQPASAARRAPCYRFRVAQAQPLSFAQLGNAGESAWKPVTELP